MMNQQPQFFNPYGMMNPYPSCYYPFPGAIPIPNYNNYYEQQMRNFPMFCGNYQPSINLDLQPQRG